MNALSKKSSKSADSNATNSKYQKRQMVLWLVLFLVVVSVVSIVYIRITDNHEENLGLSSEASGQEPDFAPITAELLNKANEYKKAPAEVKQALEEELVGIAMERRDAMKAALEKHPKAVGRAGIPEGLAKQLPSEISRFIEKQVRIDGTAEVIVTDYHDKENGINPFEYYVTDSRKNRYRVRTNDNMEKFVTGAKIRISGTLLDSNLVPDDNASAVIVTSNATVSATTQKKVAIILFNFSDRPNVNNTQDSVRASMFTAPDSVNSYYKENTYGAWEFTGHTRPDGDVFGYYTISNTSADCEANYYNWAAAADALAARDGFVASNYTNIAYQFDSGNCYWAGKGNMGGLPARTWNNTTTFNKNVVAHEMGHNFGFAHASSIRCTDASGAVVATSNTCTRNEYGDPYDVMGGAPYYHMNNRYKGSTATTNYTNWIPSQNVTTLALDQSGTFTIKPLEQPLTGTQTIRIPIDYTFPGAVGATAGYYYLEFRQPYGLFDTFLNITENANGVFIRKGRDFNKSENTLLVDATPNSAYNFADSAIKPGQPFVDPNNGLTINVLSVSPTEAVVEIVSTPAPCERANPNLRVNTSLNAPAGWSYTFNLTLTNYDSRTCPASTFDIVQTPDMPVGWSVSPRSFRETLAPGASVTRSFNVTSPTNAVPGDYRIYWVASNTDSPTYTHTSGAIYTVRDTGSGGGDALIPTVSITSPLPGATLSANTTVNILADATDNIGVTKVEFVIGRKVICSDTSAPYSCAWKVPKGKKTYNIVARAYDAAGNVGYATVSVSGQ